MKLSIIIPVYNVEPYIKRCLESVVNQDFKDFEIIIVNDGSKDGSDKIIKEFLKDKRIKYFKKENGGLSSARNYGLKHATGEYVAFLDSDDYVDLDYYKKMTDQIKTKADIIESDFIWEYPDKQVYDYTKINNKERYLIDIRVVAWNKLYKKSLIDKLNLEFTLNTRYEDVDWCYKLIPHINKIISVKNTYVHYVQRAGAITSTQNEKTKDIFKVLDSTINYYKDNNLYDKYYSELEYLTGRYLFGSSYKRVIQIKDKKLRNEIIDLSYNYVFDNFKKFRNNKYLREFSFKNIYMRLTTKTSMKLLRGLFK